MPRPRFGGFGGGGGGRGGPQGPESDPVKEGLDRVETIKSFFREAKAYLSEPKHENINLGYPGISCLSRFCGPTQKRLPHPTRILRPGKRYR